VSIDNVHFEPVFYIAKDNPFSLNTILLLHFYSSKLKRRSSTLLNSPTCLTYLYTGMQELLQMQSGPFFLHALPSIAILQDFKQNAWVLVCQAATLVNQVY
jgi:hypothetical protein